MTTELKQAAQDASEAIDWLLKNIRLDAPQLAGKAMGNAEKCASALRAAIQQAEAQQPATGEPVYWEWRHLSTHPDTVDFGKWSEWRRVEARSAIHTIEDALAEFRAYIAQGYKYELRALYTHPAPSVPGDVMRDAERYRWLRDHDHWPAPFSSSQEPEPVRGRDLDSNIDAAMLAAK